MNSFYPNMRIEGHSGTIIYIDKTDKKNAEEIAMHYIENMVLISSDRKGEDLKMLLSLCQEVLLCLLVKTGQNRSS